MEYKCSVCGKTGVKLWRDYGTFHFDLYCVDCALQDQGVSYEVNELGRYRSYYQGEYMGTTDQIEWLVPAVYDKKDNLFWGYTSVPENDAIWWQGLPLRKGESESND